MSEIKSSIKKSQRIISLIVALGLLLSMLIIPILFMVRSVSADCPTTSTEEVEVPKVENPAETETVSTEPPLISTPILFGDIQYIELYSIVESLDKIEELGVYILELEEAINSEAYEFSARYTMQLERSRLALIKQQYEMNIETFSVWESEYYYAYKTWEFFRQNGYSQEATCAILGNMMVETSGGSLALKPTIYSPGRSHYGLCQWYLKYRPFMAGVTFEEQLDYLLSDIPVEFKTFGSCYKKSFTADDFIIMTDVAKAAEAFAKVYERPGAGTYTWRAQCAQVAYDYFVFPPLICY